jgi:hypothetical protein
MLQKVIETTETQARADTGVGGLRLTLWLVWALAVAGFALIYWRATAGADLLGLGIRTGLAALVGLVVVTLIELRLEPERFDD